MGAGFRRSLRGGAKKSKKVVKKSRKTRKGGMLGTLKKFGKDVLTTSKEMLSKASNLVKFKKGGKRKTLKKKYTKAKKGGDVAFLAQHCKDENFRKAHTFECGPY